eukprot:GEMP01026191.1.p1 GENE.GEMP01026191.1~~GEMP01026191.1.p1  ORF type:complete len:227 (+),score=41.29 GEMP01026191.1:171-851(+)
MGAGSSEIEIPPDDDISAFKVKWAHIPKRTLREVWEYEQNQDGGDLILDFKHLGILWQLDKDHDGLISVHDAVCFREFCRQVCQDEDMGLQMKGQRIKALCIGELMTQVEENRSQVVDWMLALVMEGAPMKPDVGHAPLRNLYFLLRRPGMKFNNEKALHEILQQYAEVDGYLPLHDKSQDNVVPLSALHGFIEILWDRVEELLRETQIMCPVEQWDAEDFEGEDF